jgi:hypothetical protein
MRFVPAPPKCPQPRYISAAGAGESRQQPVDGPLGVNRVISDAGSDFRFTWHPKADMQTVRRKRPPALQNFASAQFSAVALVINGIFCSRT